MWMTSVSAMVDRRGSGPQSKEHILHSHSLPWTTAVCFRFANVRNSSTGKGTTRKGLKFVIYMIKWTRPSSSGFTVSDQKLDGGKACMGMRLFWDDSRSKALQLLQCVFCIEASFLLGNSLLCPGSIPERDGDKLYNTCTVFSPTGAMLGKYRKVSIECTYQSCKNLLLAYFDWMLQLLSGWMWKKCEQTLLFISLSTLLRIQVIGGQRSISNDWFSIFSLFITQ